MSNQSEVCCFCGGEIIFRTIRGVVTPMHIGDEECIGRKLYRRDQDGIPFRTNCPRCGAKVVFLRHNGGSVWLDELGWPWPKHGCFVEQTSTAWTRVWPAAALSVEGAQYMFAVSLGLPKSHDGVIVYLRHTKKDLRRNPKYNTHWQWTVECLPEQMAAIDTLFDKIPVIVSFEGCRLITLDAVEFKIRKHHPVYTQWSGERLTK